MTIATCRTCRGNGIFRRPRPVIESGGRLSYYETCWCSYHDVADDRAGAVFWRNEEGLRLVSASIEAYLAGDQDLTDHDIMTIKWYVGQWVDEVIKRAQVTFGVVPPQLHGWEGKIAAIRTAPALEACLNWLRSVAVDPIDPTVLHDAKE